MLKPLHMYTLEAAKLSGDEFVDLRPHPVIVFDPFTPMDETGFKTVLAGTKSEGAFPLVGIIAKRPGANAFSMMVTLGRARNNDIELKLPTVSKFHAYLMVSEGGAVALKDAGSSFGTFVSGRRLESGEARPLTDGERVSIGDAQGVFLTPLSFYRYLTSRR